MKVVINKCFGGFGLSHKAVRRLAQLKGRDCFIYEETYLGVDNRKYKLISPNATFDGFFAEFDAPYEDGLTKEQFSEWWNKHSLYSMWHDCDRNDLHLVQVVEELGEKANGSYSELRVVEIPDGTDYEIDEYDGMESIHEKHRSWS